MNTNNCENSEEKNFNFCSDAEDIIEDETVLIGTCLLEEQDHNEVTKGDYDPDNNDDYFSPEILRNSTRTKTGSSTQNPVINGPMNLGLNINANPFIRKTSKYNTITHVLYNPLFFNANNIKNTNTSINHNQNFGNSVKSVMSSSSTHDYDQGYSSSDIFKSQPNIIHKNFFNESPPRKHPSSMQNGHIFNFENSPQNFPKMSMNTIKELHFTQKEQEDDSENDESFNKKMKCFNIQPKFSNFYPKNRENSPSKFNNMYKTNLRNPQRTSMECKLF
jgi:hypothetical protein